MQRIQALKQILAQLVHCRLHALPSECYMMQVGRLET
jgi:hypothetical protein